MPAKGWDIVSRLNLKSALDIGANRGNFTGSLVSWWPDVDVFMIEGNPSCEPLLRGTNRPYKIALLSDVKKEVTLYVPPHNSVCTGASYYKEDTHHYVGATETAVMTETLDDIVASLGKEFEFIKLDTQGSELDILKGGAATVAKASYVLLGCSTLKGRPYNIGSPNKDEIVTYMHSIGFTTYEVVEDHVANADMANSRDTRFKLGEVFQQDILFKRRPRSARKLRIGFNARHSAIRGTTNATYDYAVHNEKVLGNESVMMWSKQAHDINNSENNPEMERFLMDSDIRMVPYDFSYDDHESLDTLCKELSLDMLYTISHGPALRTCPSVSHIVFEEGPATFSQPEFPANAYVSEYLTIIHNSKHSQKAPYVSHIVDLPPVSEDLRVTLGIPKTATVFGRHGGRFQFDNGHAQVAVDRLLQDREDVWFVFLNTNSFGVDHPRKVYLQASADRQYKSNFINACDAMLYGRTQGETFGIAIGEFSFFNKPVIIPERSREWYHMNVLGDALYKYSTEEEAYNILQSFKPAEARKKDWSMYRRFTPAVVMKEFENVFIKGVGLL